MGHSLNRILAVPNWSFFDPLLCLGVREILSGLPVKIHYVQGDVDHQRTVIAFSGKQEPVFDAMNSIADHLLPNINMESQRGVHPRVGALDVAPFVLLDGSERELISATNFWAADFSSRFDIPVHLYEKSASPGMEHRLPYLRGQVGHTEQLPDFGSLEHPQFGMSIVGVRDFLLATNINLAIGDPKEVRYVAKELRFLRDHGSPALQGVRALGFSLKSQGLTQLSLNFTRPDLTSFDAVFEMAKEINDLLDVFVIETELIGVIRERDLAGATQLSYDPSQVVR
jgi:glutamate formiminotransferase